MDPSADTLVIKEEGLQPEYIQIERLADYIKHNLEFEKLIDLSLTIDPNYKGVSKLDLATELKVFKDNNDLNGLHSLFEVLMRYFRIDSRQSEPKRVARTARFLRGMSRLADGIFYDDCKYGVFISIGLDSLYNDQPFKREGSIYDFVTSNYLTTLTLADITEEGKVPL